MFKPAARFSQRLGQARVGVVNLRCVGKKQLEKEVESP
jgi:hypothetical protein